MATVKKAEIDKHGNTPTYVKSFATLLAVGKVQLVSPKSQSDFMPFFRLVSEFRKGKGTPATCCKKLLKAWNNGSIARQVELIRQHKVEQEKNTNQKDPENPVAAKRADLEQPQAKDDLEGNFNKKSGQDSGQVQKSVKRNSPKDFMKKKIDDSELMDSEDMNMQPVPSNDKSGNVNDFKQIGDSESEDLSVSEDEEYDPKNDLEKDGNDSESDNLSGSQDADEGSATEDDAHLGFLHDKKESESDLEVADDLNRYVEFLSFVLNAKEKNLINEKKNLSKFPLQKLLIQKLKSLNEFCQQYAVKRSRVRKSGDGAMVFYIYCTLGECYQYRIDAVYVAEQERILVTCHRRGSFAHSTRKATRITGMEREELAKKLATTKATIVQGERSENVDFEAARHGNLGDLTPLGTLYQIRYELNVKGDYHKNDFIDLYLQKRDEERLGAPYIRDLADPFKAVCFTDKQIEILMDARKSGGRMVMHIDATGTVARLPRDFSGQIPYYYALVVNINRTLLPLVEFLLQSQKAVDIANCLSVFKSHMVGQRKVWPVAELVVLDCSPAMLQGVSKGLNDLDLGTYIEIVEGIATGKRSYDKKLVILANCVAHLVKLFAVLVHNEPFPNLENHNLESKKLEKRILTRMLCSLILCTTYQQFLDTFQSLCLVMFSEYETPSIVEAIKSIDSGSFEEKEFMMLCDPDKEIDAPKPSVYEQTLRQRSKCYRDCLDIVEKIQKMTLPKSAIPNLYYSPEIPAKFVKLYCHTACIWSAFVRVLIDPSYLTFSNAEAENQMKACKEVCKTSTPQKAGRVLRKLKKHNLGICNRILEKGGCLRKPRIQLAAHLPRQRGKGVKTVVPRLKRQGRKGTAASGPRRGAAATNSDRTKNPTKKLQPQKTKAKVAKDADEMESENEPKDGLYEAEENWSKRGVPLKIGTPKAVKRNSRQKFKFVPPVFTEGEEIDTFPGKYSDCTNAELQSIVRDISLDRYLMDEMANRGSQLAVLATPQEEVFPKETSKRAKQIVGQDKCGEDNGIEDMQLIVVSDSENADETSDSRFQTVDSVHSAGVTIYPDDFDCLNLDPKDPNVKSKDLYIGGEIISSFVNNCLNIAAGFGAAIYHFDSGLFPYVQTSKITFTNLIQRQKAMTCKLWILPANIVVKKFKHWVLFIVDWKDKIITCLDSLLNYECETYGGKSFLPALRLLMNSAYLAKNKKPLPADEWTVYFPADMPCQSNDYDCGLYVMYFTELLCSGQRPFCRNMIEQEYRTIVKSTVLEGKEMGVIPPAKYSTKSTAAFKGENTDNEKLETKKSRSTFKNISNKVPLEFKDTFEYLSSLRDKNKI